MHAIANGKKSLTLHFGMSVLPPILQTTHFQHLHILKAPPYCTHLAHFIDFTNVKGLFGATKGQLEGNRRATLEDEKKMPFRVGWGEK